LELPLMGHVILYKAGHDLMNQLVRKIQESTASTKIVELGADVSEAVEKYALFQIPEK